MDVAPRRRYLFWFRLICVAVAVAGVVVHIQTHQPCPSGSSISLRPDWLVAGRRGGLWLGLPARLVAVAFDAAEHRLRGPSRCDGADVTHRPFLLHDILWGGRRGFCQISAYARWYQLPLPEILAAAPLDRLLGLGGLILFIVLAFGLAAINGAFAQLEPASLKMPPLWLALILVLLVLTWIGLGRWGKQSASIRMLRAFKEGGKRLVSSWPASLQGLTCGFLVQVALAGSLAFSLQAVSHSPVPWGRLLWTFPVISVVSALPFNIAGAGLREGAVLALLGLYGVSAADAVAASLLTLVARLFWAAIGGVLLWRERAWHQHQRPVPQTLSVIISTLNEAELLPETIRRLRALPEVCEIMIADGGSCDQTRELAVQLGCRVVTDGSGSNNAIRLETAQAKGDAIVLMDADIWLPEQAGKAGGELPARPTRGGRRILENRSQRRTSVDPLGTSTSFQGISELLYDAGAGDVCPARSVDGD